MRKLQQQRDRLIARLREMAEPVSYRGRVIYRARKGYAVDDLRDVLVELDRVNQAIRKKIRK